MKSRLLRLPFLALVSTLLVMLPSACVDSDSSSQVSASSSQLSLVIGGVPMETTVAARAAAANAGSPRPVGTQQAIDTIYPFPSKVTLDIFGYTAGEAATISAAEINRDYNDGIFSLDANGSILVTQDSFLLRVPDGYFLSFTITFFNSAGYQYFQGFGDYDGIHGGGTTVQIPIQVAIDPLVPLTNPPDACVDSDADTFCDIYEDLFIDANGQPDVDGDGIPNSLDPDSDGDGLLDLDEGNAASNDGFPRYIHANQAPTAVSASVVTVQGSQSPPAPAQITDPDVGDTHTVLVLGQPSSGAAWSDIFNQLNYTPNPGFVGSDSFPIEATDQGGLSVQGIASVTVNTTANPNQPPAPLDDVVSVQSGNAILVDVLANDSDPNGDTLTITAFTQGANGSVSQSGNQLSYSASASYNGADSFTYTVSDGTYSATATVNVTVLNTPPTAVNDTALTAEDTAVVIDVLVNDSDPDSAGLSVASVTTASNGSVVNNGGNVTYTPNLNFNGADSFTYTASDGDGGTATATVNVTVSPVNDAPVAVNDTAATLEDTPVGGNVLSNDTDVDGDLLSVTTADTTSLNGGTVAVLADGSFTYTPLLNFNGADSFGYTMGDGNGGSASATVTITVSPVNDNPVANNDTENATEDTPMTTASVLTNDTDVDGDTLSVTAADSVSVNGGTVVNNANGTFTYTPALNFNGADSFGYTIGDGNGGSASATVNISVAAVNDAPLAVDDGARSVLRASFSNAGAQAAADSYWPTVNGNGRFVAFWSADSALVAGDTNGVIDLFIRDTLSNTTVRATVNSSGIEADAGEVDIFQLHAAPISADGRYVVFESRAGNLGTLNPGPVYPMGLYKHDRLEGTTTRLLECEGWPDGDSYEPSMSSDANHIAFTSLATDPWPACWVHTDANGVSDIYIISTTYGDTWASVDALGNPANGASYNPSISDDGTWVAFASAATNLLPVGGPSDTNGLDDIYLKNLSSGTVSRISVDSAGTESAGGASTQPSISANGNRIAFLSSATNLVAGDTNGVADVFVHDVQLGTTVRVSVDSAGVQANGISSAPRISKDGRFVVFESLATNLVAGDTNGTVDIFIHDTVSGQTRRLSEDAAGIEANGANDAPVLSQDGRHMVYASTASNLVAGDTNGLLDIINVSITNTVTKELVPVTTADLSANDSDVDGDPLNVSAFTAATNGTLVDNLNNTFDYTPNTGVVGLDSFSYTISDGAGGTDIAWVWLASETANYAPSAVSDTATATAPAGVVIPVLANDFDLDNDALSVVAVTQPFDGGSAINNGDGTVTYNPPTASTPHVATFTYTVGDGSGLTSTATISVTVN